VSYEDIRFEIRDDGVAIITLHRPDALNAFSGKMGEEWGEAYRRCDSDDAVRAVVVTGAGRAFCAGADMSAGEDTFASQDHNASFSAAAMSPPAWEVRKPIIAALNGHAIGIGFTLALQCDIRIAALDNKYGVVQVRRGMMPDGYAHWTLPRLVGMSRAAELLLTGKRVLGQDLERMGIASRALPADEVLPAALEIAEDIAHNASPLSVGITKKLLWESSDLRPEQVEHRETELHHHLMGGPDAIEGVMAYVERREPKWSQSVGRNWPEWPSEDD